MFGKKVSMLPWKSKGSIYEENVQTPFKNSAVQQHSRVQSYWYKVLSHGVPITVRWRSDQSHPAILAIFWNPGQTKVSGDCQRETNLLFSSQIVAIHLRRYSKQAPQSTHWEPNYVGNLEEENSGCFSRKNGPPKVKERPPLHWWPILLVRT